MQVGVYVCVTETECECVCADSAFSEHDEVYWIGCVWQRETGYVRVRECKRERVCQRETHTYCSRHVWKYEMSGRSSCRFMLVMSKQGTHSSLCDCVCVCVITV